MLAPFLKTDIAPFLAMARQEGWICGEWEFDFLLRVFPRGCFVWREHGRPLAFVTSISYGKSGWVGNLLVHPDGRRRGIGRQLMECAVTALLESGVETIWLAASEKGAGLYRRLGFFAIDTIYRWSGKGGAGEWRKPAADIDLVRAVDRGGWGDKRHALLQAACDRGRLYTSSGGFICVQSCEDGSQIGPWGSLIPSQTPQLFYHALVGAGRRVFLDVPAGNHAAAALLEENGFSVKGSNLLMYLGVEPLYRPKYIYALASMGSMG